jgi:RNA polymerase sigma-70 factor (ECF subfamily)
MSQEETDDLSGPGSFESLYQEHFSVVYKFGYRLLGDAEQARDLAQEVFLRLYRSLNGGALVHNVRGWIYRTAANLSYDWIRHETRFRKISTHGFDQSGPAHEVEKEFFKTEEIRAVRTALEQLRPRDRILLTLFQDELSYKEIARVTGLRRSSVGKLVSRAVKRLARQLEQGEKT